MSKCSDYIEIRENRAGQKRAFIAGTRVRVQDVYIEAEIHGRTPDEIVTGYPQLSVAQVHEALAYFFDNREEIKHEIRVDRELVAEAQARTGPGPLEAKLKGAQPTGDPISS